jgi:hypothetical protein
MFSDTAAHHGVPAAAYAHMQTMQQGWRVPLLHSLAEKQRQGTTPALHHHYSTHHSHSSRPSSGVPLAGHDKRPQARHTTSSPAALTSRRDKPEVCWRIPCERHRYPAPVQQQQQQSAAKAGALRSSSTRRGLQAMAHPPPQAVLAFAASSRRRGVAFALVAALLLASHFQQAACIKGPIGPVVEVPQLLSDEQKAELARLAAAAAAVYVPLTPLITCAHPLVELPLGRHESRHVL